MEIYLRHFAKVVGIVLLAASMVFSFKGFEFNFEHTDAWAILFWIIGASLTAGVTILQLIFNSDYKGLNPTLKLFGLISYVYSIGTNILGLTPFVTFGGSTWGVWIIAAALDLIPEPLIAWGMGDALRGDLISNLLKFIIPGKFTPQTQNQNHNQRRENRPAYEATSRPPIDYGARREKIKQFEGRLPKPHQNRGGQSAFDMSEAKSHRSEE